MAKIKDLAGIRFGRLIALSIAGKERDRHLRWNCICDCGNNTIVSSTNLIQGNIISCGCYKKEKMSNKFKTHNKSNTKEYNSWKSMKIRCYLDRAKEYHNYGGRGITVCERWRNSFENFLSDMGECPKGYSIDRIDNNGNYEPGNCRWADYITQANNTRANRLITYKDKTQSISMWAREFDISIKALRSRLDNGWQWEAALTTPIKTKQLC